MSSGCYNELNEEEFFSLDWHFAGFRVGGFVSYFYNFCFIVAMSMEKLGAEKKPRDLRGLTTTLAAYYLALGGKVLRNDLVTELLDELSSDEGVWRDPASANVVIRSWMERNGLDEPGGLIMEVVDYIKKVKREDNLGV